MIYRRHAALLGVALLAASLVGCGAGDDRPQPHSTSTGLERIDHALAAAGLFLASRQSPDGAWRSDTYGAFKEGDALTPLVLRSLAALSSSATSSARDKGIAYLKARVRSDGSIDEGPHGLPYPVHTSALAVEVLSLDASHQAARDAWLGYLRQRQLTEDLGWRPSDPEYGGWGYFAGVPRKPGPGEPRPPLVESNLSATAAALDALRAAGCPADDPTLRKALVFVQRCQNYAAGPAPPEPAFDDGGFFFIYDDAVRNKAGVAGKDRTGRERFTSYGSTTADGLRALLACGCGAEGPRVAAARGWLEEHFSATAHPGRYAADREANRNAVYYYYCASLAHTLNDRAGPVSWSEALADALLRRQRPDGSWLNEAVAVREDDPIVATALAMTALATCRDAVVRQPTSSGATGPREPGARK